MILLKAWASFEADKRIGGFSPQTLKAYLLKSLLLIDYFKDVEMELLDTDKLKEYLAVSGKHLKPASLAHRIRFMKSFFRWSHEEGYLSKNPTSKIKEPSRETNTQVFNRTRD
ncbi:site-specific integrase [Psychrobacillus psychrodurans]|uniref:site-specific integrase n=1 Tax=Psychrobacillus psychrodurans TaxID=126157 RepID=UPI0008E15792|nr:site-specific integrase [Psychrobacillus psychrodurans]MCZ8540738.1 site-specific integrase [Psychrobacillus psychrodurans]SFM74395.1 integrase/recombinase XerD [Psychrobacillus psychrodurans]